MKLAWDLANNSFSGEVSQFATDVEPVSHQLIGYSSPPKNLGRAMTPVGWITHFVLLGNQHDLVSNKLILVELVAATVLA